MDIIVIIGLAVLLLFGFAYITKRRFGVLGLALATGYVLSVMWQDVIADIALRLPVDLGVVSPVTFLTLLVILFPSLVLLFGGPRYKTKRGRLLGSILYAVLAVIFSLGALEHTVVLMGDSRTVFEMIVQYQQYILTAALVIAVLDIMHTRSSGAGDKHGKKH